MGASPPTGALKVNWASLFCGKAAKHELSTVSVQISRSQYSPWAEGCSGGSPRAWQHPGKGYRLAAVFFGEVVYFNVFNESNAIFIVNPYD